MIVSLTFRYINVAIFKTGSASMRLWLRDHYKGAPCTGSSGELKYHSWNIPEEFRKYYKFTLVRNPYERMMSGFFFGKRNWEIKGPPPYPLKKGMSPVEYMEAILLVKDNVSTWMPQARYVEEIQADKVLRLEDVPGNLDSLPFVEKSFPPFPHVRRTPKKPKGSFLSLMGERWAALVGEYEAETFERYGYERLL